MAPKAIPPHILATPGQTYPGLVDSSVIDTIWDLPVGAITPHPPPPPPLPRRRPQLACHARWRMLAYKLLGAYWHATLHDLAPVVNEEVDCHEPSGVEALCSAAARATTVP